VAAYKEEVHHHGPVKKVLYEGLLLIIAQMDEVGKETKTGHINSLIYGQKCLAYPKGIRYHNHTISSHSLIVALCRVDFVPAM